MVEIDDDGYPLELVSEEDDVYITWTDCAGVEDIESDRAIYPVSYYNLQGISVNKPAHGIYIVRHSDGSTTKTLIK